MKNKIMLLSIVLLLWVFVILAQVETHTTTYTIETDTSENIDSTVSEALFKDSFIENLRIVDHIDRDYLEEYPYLNLEKILVSRSSIHLIDHGSLQDNQYILNGMKRENSGVFLDGMELIFPQRGYYNLDFFPRELLSSVEVIPFDASYLSTCEASAGAIYLKPLSEIYTHDKTYVSGFWGDNSLQRFTGHFIKSYKEDFLTGITAEKTTLDLHRESGENWLQNLSAFGRGKLGDLTAYFLATRYESQYNRLKFEDSQVKPGQFDDDHRLVFGKLDYSSGKFNIYANYLHQDYKSHYDIYPNIDNTAEYDESYIDAISISIGRENCILGDIRLVADIQDYTVKNTTALDTNYLQYGGYLSIQRKIFGNILLNASTRVDYDYNQEYNLSPFLGLTTTIKDEYDAYIYGSMGNQSHYIYESDWSPSYDYLLFDSTFTDSVWNVDTTTYSKRSWENLAVTNYKSLRIGIQNSQKGEFNTRISGYLHLLENPLFEEYKITSNSIVFGMQNEHKSNIWGIDTEISYEPDSLFGMGMNYHFVKTEIDRGDYHTMELGDFDSYIPILLPKHRFSFYIQEKRYYQNGDLAVLFRLEGDSNWGIPKYDSISRYAIDEELDPSMILRGKVKADYLTFSAFAIYEYALVKTDDGFKSQDYWLDSGMNGNGYPLPANNWILGLSWMFWD